MAIHLARRG